MTCHVFVVDVIMFIKRFVVFSSLPVGVWLVQRCAMVGTMLGHG